MSVECEARASSHATVVTSYAKKAAHVDGLLYSKRGNELKQFFGDGCDVVGSHTQFGHDGVAGRRDAKAIDADCLAR